MMQRLFRQCADCGASLDPGESCGCVDQTAGQCLLLIQGTDHGVEPAIECRVGLETWRRVYKDADARNKTYQECCCKGKPCAVYGEPCRVIRPVRIRREDPQAYTRLKELLGAGRVSLC